MDFWPQNQQAENPFEKLCSYHKWPSAWLDPSEPGVVGPFLAAQGGSWVIKGGWRWDGEGEGRGLGGWEERFWPQGILGAFALGGFPFPCPSLTFKGHCNSIFWARDSELRVSHRMNLNQVKKKKKNVTREVLPIFKFLNVPGLPKKLSKLSRNPRDLKMRMKTCSHWACEIQIPSQGLEKLVGFSLSLQETQLNCTRQFSLDSPFFICELTVEELAL